MRLLGTLLVFTIASVGCAQPGAVAPLSASGTPCPRGSALEPVRASVQADPLPESPAPPVDPRERARVLASLYPDHLTDLRDCPKAGRSPTTWVEVDDLALENLDNGRFVPVVVLRERGHYTSSTDQVRYVVRLDNCQPSNIGGPLRVEAVFSEWSLTLGSPAEWRRPRPISMRELDER